MQKQKKALWRLKTAEREKRSMSRVSEHFIVLSSLELNIEHNCVLYFHYSLPPLMARTAFLASSLCAAKF